MALLQVKPYENTIKAISIIVQQFQMCFFGEVILQLGKYLKYKIEAIKRMIEENIKVNSRIYKVTVNDQTQMYAARLRKLYQQTYNDMDSYEEVSSETSTTVNNLLNHAVSPDVKEEDMDGVIHQVLKIFDKPVQKTKKTR